MAKSELEVNVQGAITHIKVNNGPFNLIQMSDIHFDSVLCNREQLYSDLEYARKNHMYVVMIGDIFDAMNGRFDPRRSMSKVRPEYRFEDYYDRIVDDAIGKLKPWRKNILMVAPGNHEGSVLKNASTDLISRLAKGLSTPGGKKTPPHNVLVGGYGGIINIEVNEFHTIPAKYFHGSGGEAPVTRGAIQTNRQAVFLPDFQIVMNGHSHHMYYIPITRERTKPPLSHFFDIQHHVRSPGYVMSYADGTDGWDVKRGGVPKPIGCIILGFEENGEVMVTPRIHPPKPIKPIPDEFEGVVFPQE